MSLNELNKSCALCHAYLFEEDDVVYCPVCGAPHHRECYNSTGHCALESAHGTENQYDKLLEKAKTNEKSKAPKDDFAPSAEPGKDDTYTPGDEIFEGLPPLDLMGGIAPNKVIEDGVTAKEARNFVITNTQYFVPKFTQLSKKNKSSWNFLAFFFPCEWLLCRKMYKRGIIVGVFVIIASLLNLPMQNTLFNLGYWDITSAAERAQFFATNLADIHFGSLLAMFAGVGLNFVLRIVVAILGDYWYRQHAISKIKEIKTTSDDIAEDYRKHGGVNLIMFVIGLIATYYLPQLVSLFI